MSGQCQFTFERLYDGATSFMFNLTELPGNNVLVGLGRTRALSTIDSEGNIVRTHSYWADSIQPITGIGAIRRQDDNAYLFAAGCRGDSCSSVGSSTLSYFHPVIGKMDSLGNIESIKQYVINSDCQNIAGDVVPTSDGGAVAWGYEQDFFAIKVDSELEPLWAEAFVHHGGFQFIKELPSGDLLAGINMDTAGVVVARMDAGGNFIWCKSYIRPGGMIHDAVIESDDSFVITGYTDSIHLNLFEPLPTNFHPKLFMMKLNGDGEVQWCRGYESEPNPWYTFQWSRIERTLDGNYVVLATLGLENTDFFYRPFLMKTDLSGDTLWTRSFGGNGDYLYETRGLLAHSDGSFVFTGDVMGQLPDLHSGLPYIFKTDSEGHFPCLDRPHPVTLSELFPVDSSFTLTSVDGAVARPALVTDTVFGPITVYDGCTDIFLEVPRATTHQRRMGIRPNPTPGHFTVEFQDPLLKDSYYSVYDAMGKLLFQRAAAHGKKTEEVDLTGYAKGTYVIRFTDLDGVCFERVVLE